MIATKCNSFLRLAAFVFLVWGMGVLLPARVLGDVLVSTNGERFVGVVIRETATNVVFESESAGELTFSRTYIRELQQGSSAAVTNAIPVPVVATKTQTNTAAWKPPGVGTDKADWVELKSGEWLRGELKYIQNKEVEFDSDEMDLQTLKLKDVRRVYTAHRVFTQFEYRKPVYGKVVISNDVVNVIGPESLSLHRDLLIGITPSGGDAGLNDWSGDLNMGLSFQSGNHNVVTVTTSAELARRTPNTTLLLNYLGNYSKADGVENANNNRVNLTYDVRLNKEWFVRPVQFEYYNDPLANIDCRLTAGVGAGYYVFDRTGLEWQLSAGPSYQYTRFSTVQAGDDDIATTPAAVLNSYFKADITSRLTFIQSWASTFSKKEAGAYTHHTVTTLEFEIKRHLDLDVSFIWDYLQNPQTQSDGVVPQKNDEYLTVGLGIRF